jgi:hypothetical protein
MYKYKYNNCRQEGKELKPPTFYYGQRKKTRLKTSAPFLKIGEKPNSRIYIPDSNYLAVDGARLKYII